MNLILHICSSSSTWEGSLLATCAIQESSFGSDFGANGTCQEGGTRRQANCAQECQNTSIVKSRLEGRPKHSAQHSFGKRSSPDSARQQHMMT